MGVRPSTTKRPLADLRARSGFRTEQLVYRGRAEERAGERGSVSLSHSTVKHHLANGRAKVGATTISQLVWILAERLPAPDHAAKSDG